MAVQLREKEVEIEKRGEQLSAEIQKYQSGQQCLQRMMTTLESRTQIFDIGIMEDDRDEEFMTSGET